ncbi:hypothetical protein [Paracoccus sp. IB05]|uniref:hypothetical protein n=1 Tax=Paracoccus sp. IB05 TaxID=2779367 RepID=UPI0018E7ED9E|nr:hypothetical protein [Paracoccus sp. IB05]MBJ2150668.1 hypothetical protein [Paracoccus sp. IB05]
MGKRFVISEAASLKAIAIAQKAGLNIHGLEFPRDGSIRILTAEVDKPDTDDKDERKPEPWT